MSFIDEKIPKLRKKEGHPFEAVEMRKEWLQMKTGASLSHIQIDPAYCKEIGGNIENLIGLATLPLGIAGPLKVNGSTAKGTFYIPFATTEATLVESISIGMTAVSKDGGANVLLHHDEIHISPVFLVEGLIEAENLKTWIEDHFDAIKAEAESTTRNGKLKKLQVHILGARVLVRFFYETGDAVGSNIITFATEKACQFIKKHTLHPFFLRSNFSSEKKAAFSNLTACYGKNVSAEVTLKRNTIKRYFRTTPEEMHAFWLSNMIGSMYSGSIGMNGHMANSLAAIYIACGQDVASITNSSTGIIMCDITTQGDLYVALKIPNLVVGTVGGGTYLRTQKDCLELIGCYGTGKVKKFTEIVAGALLSAEISIGAALAGGHFSIGHVKSRKTRKSIFEPEVPEKSEGS